MASHTLQRGKLRSGEVKALGQGGRASRVGLRAVCPPYPTLRVGPEPGAEAAVNSDPTGGKPARGPRLRAHPPGHPGA